MSVKYLPKQLPSDHIVQRRFSPYKKASFYIRHFEKAKFSPRTSVMLETESNAMVTEKNLPNEDSKVLSLVPMSNLSTEIKQKIEAINNFNNLSESKPAKFKKSRQVSTPSTRNRKFQMKIEKKNYYELIHKAFNEVNKICTKENNLCDKETRGNVRPYTNCKSLEKITSTRGTDRVELVKTEFASFDNFFCKDKQKVSRVRSIKSDRQSKILDFTKDLIKKRNKPLFKKTKLEIELKDIISISPITDTNKCIGFNLKMH